MHAVRLAYICGALTLLTGCNDYFDHDDRLSPYSGEAIAANRVAQMVDPWPAEAANPRINTDGPRMLHAMDHYKNGAPSLGGPAPGGAPGAPASPGNPAGNGQQSGNAGGSQTGSSY